MSCKNFAFKIPCFFLQNLCRYLHCYLRMKLSITLHFIFLRKIRDCDHRFDNVALVAIPSHPIVIASFLIIIILKSPATWPSMTPVTTWLLLLHMNLLLTNRRFCSFVTSISLVMCSIESILISIVFV